MTASPPIRSAPSARRRKPSTNRLLAALPASIHTAIASHLEPVQLINGQVLTAAGTPIPWVYFPDSAVLSVVAEMADGAVAEAGTVGREGFAGLPLVFGVDSAPLRCFVQVAGNARRIDAQSFGRLLAKHAPLRTLLLRYAHTYLCQVAQTAACNALHPIGDRCARWLLMTDDRARANPAIEDGPGSFELTQLSLAYMLGVRREGVSAAARVLRTAGLIRFGRGRVTVLDRRGLERAACECYDVVRSEHQRVLG